MNYILDPAAADHVAALYGAVLAIDADAGAHATATAAIAARRAALAAQLVTCDHERPSDALDGSHDLASALAADPEAPRSASWLKRVQTARTAAAQLMTDWEARCELIVRAMALVDAEVAAADKRREALDAKRAAAFDAFNEASRAALAAEFPARFEAFHDEVLAPFVAFTRGQRTLGDLQIDDDVSRLVLNSWESTPYGGNRLREWQVFPAKGPAPYHPAFGEFCDAMAERFKGANGRI